MEFKALIDARRSVRGYAAAVPHDDLVTILTRAQQSPSWKNTQTARCYAVESPEMLHKVREALPGFNRNSSANAALLVTTYVKGESGFISEYPANEVDDWGAYDLGLRDAYLILAASDMGYDTLIMGIRDADVLRALLNIPDEEEVMSVIAVGKRAAAPVQKPRKPLGEVAKFF